LLVAKSRTLIQFY